MSDEEHDARTWAAERRDFVAERRDHISHGRDHIADRRDAVADERERLADERDALSIVAQQDPKRGADRPETAGSDASTMSDAGAERRTARQERDQHASERTIAATEREHAEKRRLADNPTTQLALVFAEISQHLFEATDFDDVLTRIVAVAVSSLPGCDMASITASDRSGYRTVASTHDAATKADHAQYDVDEGPCLDAIDEPKVYSPRLPDPRWPALGERPSRYGVESILSYRLTPADQNAVGAALPGSLNTYAQERDPFDADTQEVGLILAAHASVAARAAHERDTIDAARRNLIEALSSRDVIGQAKGILMERLRITPEDAFDLLRRSSQQLNIKLREIASTLTQTGELDGGHPS